MSFEFGNLPVPAVLLDRQLRVTAYRPGMAARGETPRISVGRQIGEGLPAGPAAALAAAGAVAQQLGAFRGALTLPEANGAGQWDCLWYSSEEGSVAMFLGRIPTPAAERRSQREQRNLDEAWRQAALDAFAGACAHELAQPLATAEAAAAALGLLSSEAQCQPAMAQLRAAVARAGELLRMLRRQAMTPLAPTDAIDPVAEIRTALADLATPRPVSFRPPARVPEVAAAKHVVELIVLNLVRNAWSAADADERQVAVEISASADGVEIVVADNGPGIPAELVPRLVAPVGKQGVAGMGLAIARRLAELYGGTLRLVANEPGRRTAFAAVLPLAAVASAA